MKATKWYTLLTLATALLLFSGTTTATHNQSSASGPPLVAPADCTGWSVVSSPSPGSGINTLISVTALSASDVWAVGIYFNSSNIALTLTEHWDGSSWSIVASPNPSSNRNELNGVAAISPSDVWAVGRGYTDTLVEHWNGSSWSVVASPNLGTFSNSLNSVTARSSNDVWAVGSYSSTSADSNTLVEHWDGSSWSVIPSPNPGTSYKTLNGVAAISPSDVWAVGWYINGSSSFQTLTEHWDGSSWSVVSSPNDNSDVLQGVAAITSSDVWAVGNQSSGSFNTLTEHWNGSSWGVVPSPGRNQLVGVAAISSSDVWAVGISFAGTTQTEHWNGASWSVIPSPSPGTTINYLKGVTAISPSDVWAVGAYGSSNNSSNTLVEHYTASPCGTPTVCPVPFVDIAGNVFYNAIAYLYCRGDLNGTDPTHYSPALTTTRAQFAKVVVLAFGLPSYTPSSGQDFTDVPPNYFAFGYIETGYHAGILGGYDANTCAAHNAQFPCYLPNLPITRGQVTKLIVSAAHYPLITPTSGQTFTDVPPSNVFFVSIETAHAHGVINGYPDGTFRPNNNVRRDEMAQIVYKGVTTP